MTERILHVLTAPRAEGTPRLVLDWLSVEGFSQGVLCLAAMPTELEPDLRAKAAWWNKVDLIRPGLAKYRSIPHAVQEACQQFRPDVVVSWPTWTAGLVGLGAHRAGIRRMVQHCGNPARQELGARLLGDVRFLPFYMTGGIFACCSDYVRDSFRRRTPFFKNRFQTSYNCVQSGMIAERANRAHATQQAGEGPVLLMVATMEDHKDHGTLLRAFALLLQHEPSVRLRLAGDGHLRPLWEALTAELGIAERVEFLGARKDIPELLGNADLFVFSTTRQEGLGIVLLEAMAAGVPVVASDVPACRELLSGGTYGLLVTPNDVRALSAGMASVLSEQGGIAVQTQIGLAQDFARKFTPQRMMAEYLGLAHRSSASKDN